MTNTSSPISIDNLQATLLSLDKELTDRLEKLQLDITQSHSADSEEQAIERENDEVIAQLVDSTNRELGQVKHALNRIEAGTYGLCEKCGGDIGMDRLQALPYTTRCINCVTAG